MRGLPRGPSLKGTVPPLKSQRGYLLITVVVMLFLVASIAMLLNYDSAISANTSSSELETARADYVAEAAMQHALWRAGNNACMGDVTIPITALGQDSYAATITGAAAGTLYSLTADQDAWIRSDDVTKNNGTNADQHLRFESGNVEQALTRFNLSSLPAGAQINSATAWFYITPSGPGGGAHPEGPVTVHRVTADWTETGATWDTMNGNFESSILATISAQPVDAVRVKFNLTGQVQAWVNGQPNYGILMISDSEGVHGKYVSREGAVSEQPYVEVVVGSGPASPVEIQATGTLANGVTRILSRPQTAAYQPPVVHTFSPGPAESEDAEIWDQAPNNNYGDSAEIWVSTASNDTTRSLLRFNMGAIPAGTKVLEATLSLYRQSGSGADQPVSAHRIMNSWSEGSVTWNSRDSGTNWDTAGGDFGAMTVATTAVGPGNQPYEWDITSLAQGWVDGSYPNYGVALTAAIDGMTGERFYTSDQAVLERRPSLSVTYACECGSPCMAPQGSGNVLLVVADPTILVPGDAVKKALFESWGYNVNLQNDGAGQTSFDSKFATNDVVYISESVSSSAIGSKLTNAPIGVVSEEGALNDELGIATAEASPVGSTINVSDNSHFITQVFPTGPLDIYSADMAGKAVAGTEAPGLQTLGDWSGAGGPVVLDTGAALGGDVSGENAAGRRVLLPIGNNIDLSNVNNNGHLIMQRAIAWGMNADGGGIGRLLMVVGNDAGLTSQENAKKSLIESWGYTVNLIDESDAQEVFDKNLANNDVVFVTEDVTASDVNTKLTGATIGVVTEEANLSDELGLSASIDWDSGINIEINNNAHYITSPFPTGLLAVLSSSESLAYVTGAEAPELGKLASSSSGYGLVTLDAGAGTHNGEIASGRRTMLPWGGSNMDVNHLNTDGLTIFQRALDWGAGAGCGSITPLLLVVSDASNPSSQETARQTLIEAWCYAVTLISDDAASVIYATEMALNDVMYISQEITTHTIFSKIRDAAIGIVNEEYLISSHLGFGAGTGSGFFNDINIVDNTHYITSELSLGALALFEPSYDIYTGTGFTLAPDLQVLGETGSITGLMALETGGALWDSGTAAGRRVQVPWGDDFSALNTDGQTIMQRAIEWAAESGGSTPLLFVVGDPASLTTGEAGRKTQFATWGFSVTLIDDADSAASFTTALTATDVVYVSSSIKSSALSGKLEDTAVGIVNEPGLMIDNFGLNGGSQTVSDTGLDIEAPAHYIMSEFMASTVTIFSTSTVMTVLGSTDAPGLVTVAEPAANGPNPSSVATLETGAERYDGNPSAGRRVHLPIASVELSQLTADGLTLMRRAIEWAAGPGSGDGGGGGGGSAEYQDNFDVAAYNGTNGTTDWSGDPWREMTESDGPNSGKLLVATDSVIPDGGNLRLVVDSRFVEVNRTADLSSFSSAHLSFDYRREWYPTPSDYFSILVSQNGSSFDEIDRIYGIANDPVYRSIVYDISSYASANTAIAIETGGINTGQTLFVDNIRIGSGPPSGCAGSFGDEFDSRTYSNSDGTLPWASDWTEIKENNGPTSGDIQIRNEINDYQLRVRDDGYGLWREADLTGAQAATLIFDYKRVGLDSSSDYVTVDVSGDGGSSWTELDRFQGSGNDTLYQFRYYDITSFAASNTRIRLLGSPDLGGQDTVWFDDIEILCSP